ncbi:hypothetical protein BSR29_02290 [Boudabousia liubingyangii]|uniref:Type II secretion system protein GspF domain-containing protein n=1 Tax=Boudabousia liubingyangii TaxID=1921764 RepID=A0A1Q5PQQ0_9ACTO|nr:type II secretion system F family protein [Boudabousia liubingyangii]OKL49799.1 hypothetical protein BSR29_02290 [Boudabousia liubingyangii]
MGALVGILTGIGLALCYWAYTFPDEYQLRPPKLEKTRALFAEAGYFDTPPSLLWLASFVAFLMGTLISFALTKTPLIALIIGLGLAAMPYLFLVNQGKRRFLLRRAHWPNILDEIIAGVRAGLPLPEILSQLGRPNSNPMSADFAAFTSDFKATGSFVKALETLRARLNDTEADRLIHALRISYEVGGCDLGLLLRDLSAMMRADLRTRGELESRQSWTKNAARLAVLTPWIVLLMITTRTGGANVYATTQGSMILVFGLLVTLFAYWLMNRLGQLPVRIR